MDAFFNSFLLVFASEMGDKTQLLALLLTAKYRRPWTILLGVFIATILNHALASYAGNWVASLVDPKTMGWVLAGLFLAFAGWILIPDKEEDIKNESRFGPLITTVVAFFIAEMGDKTQLATIALGASYSSAAIVTFGSTLGMMGSNALAIFLGDKLLQRVPMKWVRIFASLLFALFAIGIIIKFNF